MPLLQSCLALAASPCWHASQMYSELDVDAEMQRGPVMGAMALWNKAGDGLRRVRLDAGTCWLHCACPVGAVTVFLVAAAAA